MSAKSDYFGLSKFTFGLVLVVAFGFSIAYLASKNMLDLGLGWAKKPGLLLLIANTAVAFYGLFRRARWSCVVCSWVFICCAISLESFVAIGPIWIMLGLGSCMIGAAFTLLDSEASFEWKIMTCALAAYVQAVFFYNVIMPNQLTLFFRAGWTT